MTFLPDDPVVRVPIEVHFFDTDAGGVVHNTVYLRWIEIGRDTLARQLGWSLEEMLRGDHGCPVVTRTEIDYLKPVRLGQSVVVESRLTSLGRVRFVITSTVATPDGPVHCRAVQTLAAVDLKRMRPVRLRADWVARWPHLVQEPMS